MDAAERERRRIEIAEKVRQQQALTGRDALPSYLDVITDLLIDTQERIEALETKTRRSGFIGG